jgi:carboxypeptidase family protein
MILPKAGVGNSFLNRLQRTLEVAMRITWQSILPTLLIVVPILAVGGIPRTQEPSSGATSTKHNAVIKGTVVSANGKHQNKAHVTLINLSTEEKTETQTNKSGRFQFSELFSGQYKLEVKTETGETVSDEVSLGSGQTVVRKLVVKRQG